MALNTSCMRAALLFLALTVAACGEMRPQAAREQHGASRALMFNAASETARSFTGDMTMDGLTLRFGKGAVLVTQPMPRREPVEPIVRGGPSFAAAALGPPDSVVEVRRIVAESLAQGAPSLCGNGETPSYVALVYGQRSTRVTLMLFSGADAPGSDASKSWLCATYAYTAPDGVRTRQGVLL